MQLTHLCDWVIEYETIMDLRGPPPCMHETSLIPRPTVEVWDMAPVLFPDQQ